ncbi:MAG: endonuclease domain-containing protein [Chitinophagales bacterium]|nr:endonuclease domain-containing protein [Saprospirales bacterium]MBP6660247.1 endonuclease domain-containing protein [Chitinophagales bacterium]
MYNKLFFDSSKNIVENAKELRQRQTKAEEILWQFLRNKNINGLKFRRQHYIKNYIADFYCSEKMLSIELDGGIHLNKEQIEYDEFRTKVLNELGITELRFTNEEIIENVTAVINKIKSELNKL